MEKRYAMTMLRNMFSKLRNKMANHKDDAPKTKYSFTSLWVQDTLPDYVRLCINSFLKNGHAYTLFTYGKLSIPGVTVRDAREIFPEKEIFRDRSTKSLAPFSDLFRWKWLYDEGGIWVDADVACLVSAHLPLCASDEPLPRPYFCYEDMTQSFVSASCVQLQKRSQIAGCLCNISFDPLLRCPWETAAMHKERISYYPKHKGGEGRKRCQEIMPWAFSSTLSLTNLLRHLYGKYPITVAPSKALFPVHYTNAHKLYDGSVRLKDIDTKETWAIHLWGHELAKNKYNIHTQNPSLMTDLLDKYGMCEVK